MDDPLLKRLERDAGVEEITDSIAAIRDNLVAHGWPQKEARAAAQQIYLVIIAKF